MGKFSSISLYCHVITVNTFFLSPSFLRADLSSVNLRLLCRASAKDLYINFDELMRGFDGEGGGGEEAGGGGKGRERLFFWRGWSPGRKRAESLMSSSGGGGERGLGGSEKRVGRGGWGGVRDNLVGKALKRFTGRFLVVLQNLCPGLVVVVISLFLSLF